VNRTLTHNLAVVALFTCTAFPRWLADLFQNFCYRTVVSNAEPKNMEDTRTILLFEPEG
jgi:hypothetical protein